MGRWEAVDSDNTIKPMFYPCHEHTQFMLALLQFIDKVKQFEQSQPFSFFLHQRLNENRGKRLLRQLLIIDLLLIYPVCFRPKFVHPDLGIGGAERLVVDAAVGLQDQGKHLVTMFTSHHDRTHCFEETRDGTGHRMYMQTRN